MTMKTDYTRRFTIHSIISMVQARMDMIYFALQANTRHLKNTDITTEELQRMRKAVLPHLTQMVLSIM